MSYKNDIEQNDVLDDEDVSVASDMEVNDSCDCEQCDCEVCDCDENQQVEENEAEKYLSLAKRVQADFDNFRKHANEDIKKARTSGQESVIEVFLPCLDTFKEAKKSIEDENVLKGVEMVENQILNSLQSLGVEKIDTVGKTYDPHLHNVIAVMKDEDKDNDIILDEFQAGYKFHDKIIRYAKVIVNKKED